MELYRTGELQHRAEILLSKLKSCDICPRRCNIDRFAGKKGFCKSDANLKVSSVGPHFGEEPELVGRYGSGTIFFTYCNLGCIFCQNYDISHLGNGKIITYEDLANYMLYLQQIGCHNINLVTPTHFTPQIVQGLIIAIKHGLNIPVVYNCGGYEDIETLRLLDGIIDIYMPDAKYADKDIAKKYSSAYDYPDVMQKALYEMYRQVGDLKVSPEGIAWRGLLIRHLVLPEGLAGTDKIMQFIANNISTNTYVNIMAQYRPVYKAYEYPELNRGISITEYNEALNIAEKAGLKRQNV